MIQVDLAGHATSVEMSDVALSVVATRQPIEWASPVRYWISYRFNRLGCRGGDTPPRSAGERRLLFLGDSYTAGVGVKEDDTFAMRVQHLLGDTGPAGARHRVLNCGVAGYGTREARKFFEERAGELDPDVVVLTVTHNDDKLARDEGTVWSAWPIIDAPASLWMRRAQLDWNGRPRDSLDLGVISNEVDQLARLVRQHGAQFVVALFQDSDDPQWKRVHDRLGAVLGGAGVALIDLGPTLRANHSWSDLRVHERVDSHPSEIAHGIVADGLATVLRRLGGP